MIELHRRQSRALLLELLHDEIASSDLVSTFMNIRILYTDPARLHAAANALVCNVMALPS